MSARFQGARDRMGASEAEAEAPTRALGRRAPGEQHTESEFILAVSEVWMGNPAPAASPL